MSATIILKNVRAVLGTCLGLMATIGAHANTDPEQVEEADAWQEAESKTRVTASLETWLYASHTALQAGSLLNPGNRLAQTPENQWVSDTRFNIKLDRGDFQALLQPRQVMQWDRPGHETDASVRNNIRQNSSETLFTQAHLRWKHGQHAAVVGRELLSWGPATFRSPSNPLYFDSGRTSPLIATPGVDLTRYTYSLGDFRLNVARVFATDQLNPKVDLGQSTVLKIDHQGDGHLLSLSMVRSKDRGDYVGGFLQYAPDDAWLLYGEYGIARPTRAQPVPSALEVIQGGLTQVARLQQPPSSGGSSILGAAYTLHSGHIATMEWMRSQGGLTGSQQRRFFDEVEQIRQAPFNQQVNTTLGGGKLLRTPPLLGRDYLWMSLQSNPQETRQYWRAELSHSAQDRSRRLLLYAEKTFRSKVSAFVAITASDGGPRSDFGAFVKGSVTVGLKLFVF